MQQKCLTEKKNWNTTGSNIFLVGESSSKLIHSFIHSFIHWLPRVNILVMIKKHWEMNNIKWGESFFYSFSFSSQEPSTFNIINWIQKFQNSFQKIKTHNSLKQAPTTHKKSWISDEIKVENLLFILWILVWIKLNVIR